VILNDASIYTFVPLSTFGISGSISCRKACVLSSVDKSGSLRTIFCCDELGGVYLVLRCKLSSITTSSITTSFVKIDDPFCVFADIIQCNIDVRSVNIVSETDITSLVEEIPARRTIGGADPISASVI